MDQRELSNQCFTERRNLIRPANYMGAWSGKGWARIKPETRNSKSEIGNLKESHGVNFLIINLNGKVFFNEEKFGGIKNPFVAADEIIANVAKEDDIILVDFHAEATSEKAALGWHLDGRANFVYGTHQHVPTADQRILPNGTGFVTDIGMTGPLNSVIGADKEIALASYLDPSKKFKMEVPEEGPVVVRAMLLEIGEDKKIQNITRLEKIVD
jgi:calcineurin-like phosphoesterase